MPQVLKLSYKNNDNLLAIFSLELYGQTLIIPFAAGGGAKVFVGEFLVAIAKIMTADKANMDRIMEFRFILLRFNDKKLASNHSMVNS